MTNGRPSIYPWSKWFTRKTPLILGKEDYTATQGSMAVMIRQQARNYGVWVRVEKLDKGSIKLTVLGKRDPETKM